MRFDYPVLVLIKTNVINGHKTQVDSGRLILSREAPCGSRRKPLFLIEALFTGENRTCPLPVLTTSRSQLPLRGPSSSIIKTNELSSGELPGQAINRPAFCSKALGYLLHSLLGPSGQPVRVGGTAHPKSGQFVFYQ